MASDDIDANIDAVLHVLCLTRGQWEANDANDDNPTNDTSLIAEKLKFLSLIIAFNMIFIGNDYFSNN